MANPALISATKNNAAIAAANTSATVSSTGSVTAGNIMVVAIEVAGAVAPTGITAPDGSWTTFLATTTTEASGLVSAAIFYKRATATGSFSGSFSWTTASTGGEWSFTEWAGAGGGIVDGTVGTTLNASSTSPTSPSKTPAAGVVNDTLVCMIFGGVLSTSTVAIPGGMNSILTVNGSATQPLFGAASLGLASVGATGAETWTLGTGQAVLGASFLLLAGDDTNRHFLGRFQPVQHEVWPEYRFDSIDSSINGVTAVVSVTNNAFVMTYNVPRAPVETSYNLYFRGDASQSGPLPVQIETQPHFIARPWPVQYRVLPALRGNISADVSGPLPVQAETQPHFLGRFTAPVTARYLYLFNLATDLPPPVASTANPHFSPRYWNPELTLLMDLWQGQSGDLPPSVDAPANFIARFTAPTFARLPSLGWATDANGPLPVQPTTNPHFVANPWPVSFKVLPLLRQNVPLDPVVPPQLETNVNFLGRFVPPPHAVLRLLRQNIAADASTATVQPETQPHFLGRFSQTIFKRFAYNLTPEDLSGFVQPETNVHFVGKFIAPQHQVLPALRSNVAADQSTPQVQPETNTHFIGHFRPSAHNVLRSLFSNAPSDAQPIIVPETNAHYVPKTWPVRFARPVESTDASRSSATAQPETNVHIIGRFTAPKFASFRFNYSGSDFGQTVPAFETNPHWMGRFSEPQFSRAVWTLALGNVAVSPPYPDRAIASDVASFLSLASDI